MPEQILILIPLYNDAESLNILLKDLANTPGFGEGDTVSVLVINDGSTEKTVISSHYPAKILHLQRNIGHQKAIAIGLAHCKENEQFSKILIMDSDGEDRPQDAQLLLNESLNNPEKIVFARRKSRQEGKKFRFYYWIYKVFFRVLTGKGIAFGNFLVMPKNIVDKVVHYSEIWSHIAAGIIKTDLPYTDIVTHRGKRYAGQSKMKFNGLLIHGLGAISVFIEVIASRLLLFSLILIFISLVTIFILIGIKTFTDRAIPGWTSTVISAMLIILLQSFLLSLFTLFLYLSTLSQRKFIPASHYKDYTGKVENIN